MDQESEEVVADALVESESLNEGGKRALDAERKARRDAERQLKATSAKLAELEDRDKSEAEKLRDELERARAEAAAAQAAVLRADVAAEKGLSVAQAEFLSGGTREELEAAADKIKEILAPAPVVVPGRPKPKESVPGRGAAEVSAKERAVAAMRQLRNV